MGLPASWSEVYSRFADRLGGDREEALRDVEEWLREAVEARYRTATLHDLDRVGRQIVFQKASGIVLALEEAGLPEELVAPDGDLPPMLLYGDGSLEPFGDYPGRRGAIAERVARYFDGVVVEGPPWRLTELETERPLYDDYVAAADFG